MSDKCSMEIETLKEHEKAFEALGFEVIDRKDDGTIIMIDYEADGGHANEMPTLPYIAYYDAGDNYEGGMEVCDGVDTIGCSCISEGVPVVPVDEDGEVSLVELTHVRDVIEMRKNVKAMFVEAKKK